MKFLNKIFLSGATCALLFTQLVSAQLAECEAQKNDASQSFSETFTKDLLERESLFLDLLAVKFMPDSGFKPFANWTGEQWSNLSGGLESGTIWDSLFTLGFEQDLSKLANRKGLGSIAMSVFYYTQTEDFSSSKVCALSDPSNIFSGDMVRIFEVYYKNEIETSAGNFAVRLGQLAADEDFMGFDYADVFLNSSFGAIPANAANCLADGALAFSQYSLATLGLTLSYAVDDFDAIVGIYNGSCGEDISSNHGFDYNLQGIALWYQLGYNYEVCGLSGRAMIGGNYNSNRFLNYDSGESERNYYSFYAALQQDLILNQDSETLLGGFVRMAWAPDERIADCTKYIDCGLNWFAPIPSRKNDVLALGYSLMETGGGLRDFDGTRRWDNMIELTYRAQLTGSIAIQPSFQTYFNAADKYGNRDTSFVLGIRAEVNF